jgi:hypothetical protein
MSDYYSPASASDGNRNSRQGSDICPDLGHDTDYFLEHAQKLHHQTFLHQNPIKKNETRRALPFNFPMDSPKRNCQSLLSRAGVIGFLPPPSGAQKGPHTNFRHR